MQNFAIDPIPHYCVPVVPIQSARVPLLADARGGGLQGGPRVYGAAQAKGSDRVQMRGDPVRARRVIRAVRQAPSW